VTRLQGILKKGKFWYTTKSEGKGEESRVKRIVKRLRGKDAKRTNVRREENLVWLITFESEHQKRGETGSAGNRKKGKCSLYNAGYETRKRKGTCSPE